MRLHTTLKRPENELQSQEAEVKEVKEENQNFELTAHRATPNSSRTHNLPLFKPNKSVKVES